MRVSGVRSRAALWMRLGIVALFAAVSTAMGAPAPAALGGAPVSAFASSWQAQATQDQPPWPTPFWPLAKGSFWVYAVTYYDGSKFGFTATSKGPTDPTSGSETRVQFDLSAGRGIPARWRLIVRSDGIYAEAQPAPQPLLPLPVALGQSRPVRLAARDENGEWTAEGSIAVTKTGLAVQVPAGSFTGCAEVAGRLQWQLDARPAGQSEQSTIFCPGVGYVRMQDRIIRGTGYQPYVEELQQYQIAAP